MFYLHFFAERGLVEGRIVRCFQKYYLFDVRI